MTHDVKSQRWSLPYGIPLIQSKCVVWTNCCIVRHSLKTQNALAAGRWLIFLSTLLLSFRSLSQRTSQSCRLTRSQLLRCFIIKPLNLIQILYRPLLMNSFTPVASHPEEQGLCFLDYVWTKNSRNDFFFCFFGFGYKVMLHHLFRLSTVAVHTTYCIFLIVLGFFFHYFRALTFLQFSSFGRQVNLQKTSFGKSFYLDLKLGRNTEKKKPRYSVFERNTLNDSKKTLSLKT